MVSRVKRVLPLAAAAVVCAAAVPASASAAALVADRGCYGPNERVSLTGTGFTPAGRVNLLENGLPLAAGPADSGGGFTYGFGAPTIRRGETRRTYTANDTTNPALTGTTRVRYTALDVTVRPQRGRPDALRRIGARGFTPDRTLYAHVRRGRFRKNIRIGRLRGPCKTLTTRKRLFRRGTATGTYRIVFNGSRRSTSRAPSVSYLVTIFRTARSSGASAATAATGERWTRVR
jgi:hypothetical protein